MRILRRWAYSEESVAMDEISGLFPGKDNLSECMYIIRPYEFSLSKSEIFSKWKSKSGNGQLTIISTCRADPPARTYAETLRNPRIQIIDGDNLIRLVQRSGIAPPPRPALSERLKSAVRTLRFSFQHFSRKRCLLIGLVMFAMYMLLGSAYYLALAVGLWFLAGISRRIQQT